MGNLVQAAESLNINKGISVYTVTHFDINGFDLRSSNLSNNFNNGTSLRIDKKNIKSTNAYVYSEDGNLEKPVVYSDFIGRLYHQNDEIENPNLKFITEEGFSKFESAIREINIRDNVNYFYKNIVPVDYNSDIFGNYNPDKVPKTSSLGDEYSVNGHILHSDHGFLVNSGVDYANELTHYTKKVSEWTGNNGMSSENRYYYNGLIPSNIMETQGEADIITNHRDRNYTVGSIKDIIKIAEYERNKYSLRNLRYDYDYFIEHISPDQKLDEGLLNRNYGDLERIIDISYSQTILGKFGLYKNSENLRNDNANDNPYYTYKSPYAIGPETESDAKIEYFSVNESNKIFNEIVITKSNGGSTNGQYYSEHDEGGSIPNDIINGTFIPLENKNEYSKLIERTNKLFNEQKIGSLINRFHTTKKDFDDELITSKSEYGLSKGRNLLVKNPGDKNLDENGYENPYCRVWTARHQYGKLTTLIRPFKTTKDIGDVQGMYKETNLRPNNGGTVLANNSVLMDNGFVRITPMHDEIFYGKNNNNVDANIKSYMFSIENLAWRDVLISTELSKEQQGPNGGRIMWFPPYNLKFTENVNVDWNANKFIGRGEQIYTYTNTDRSGTLSFTLLIDHPSIINKWRGTAGDPGGDNNEKKELENDILRYFAGCDLLDGSCGNGVNKPNENTDSGQTPNNPVYQGRTKKVALVLFFPNNFSAEDYKKNISKAIEKLKLYEKGTSGTEWINEEDKYIQNQVYENKNYSKFNLNYDPQDPNGNTDVKAQIKKTLFGGDESIEVYSFFDSENGYDRLNDVIQNTESSGGTIFGEVGSNIEISVIEAKGYASSHGYEENNLKLCDRRKNFIKLATNDKCENIDSQLFKDTDGQIIKMNDVGTENRDINSLEAKIARCAYVLFNIKWDDETTTNSAPSENGYTVNEQNFSNTVENLIDSAINKSEITITSTEESEYSCDNEYLYFAKIEEDKDFAYEKIINRIRYFNPAYHSVTPEGFNARLTFLQQCTRQGPTLDLSSGNHDESSPNYVKYAGNLSFGRAPYCVLRIGDFFHTKICITSLSIDYAADNGIQWDLNPEGAGVQPMFANVNINFNFIGGQDITGPVERLQNAVSSNYYANASVYDKKANTTYSPGLVR